MKTFRFAFVISLVCAGFGLVWLFSKTPENQITQSNFNDVFNPNTTGYERAVNIRRFTFPTDHGAHNRFRSEWWYFTGNLVNPYGRLFGYELTFFRFALKPLADESQSTWRSNQVYMAHLAITDVKDQKFYAEERFSRAGNQLAGASDEKFQVWLYDWSATADDASDSVLRLKAESEKLALELNLTPLHGPILQGDRGLSQKSAESGNASYYYAYPRLKTEGRIRIGHDQYSVTGNSWLDREWSTSALAPNQQGWDWFALQLDNDTELMFYQLRGKKGEMDPYSAGSLIHRDGKKIALSNHDVKVTVLSHWTSPHSGIVYPSAWRLEIPSRQLSLTIEPLLDDQELNLSYRYWEGAVRVTGTDNAKTVNGSGYVELAGYQ